ncbi:MAG: Sir2 family NAD-dependent protein deacetylase [Euryarchaeota archaeon]|nr:Sir2 family NAD-dependent protein deacetylase [Euryarchaeota archaeon]
MEPPVVVLTGAGVSTPSGIPDFRSPNGIWKRFDPKEFTIDRFHADPARFWERRKALTLETRILDAEPNDAHHAIARAVQEGRVATVVTQNIDGLHIRAGTPEEALIEVHGNVHRSRCMDCRGSQSTRDLIDALVPGEAPRCGCGGLLRPDVVLFGEPVTELERSARAVADARTLVVAGSSLSVWPVAGLVESACSQGAEVVLVNRDPTPFDGRVAHILRGPVEEELSRLFA